MKKDGKRYLPIGEAAEYTGLSVKQVRRFFDLGAFAGFVTEGGHREISLESLEAFNADPKSATQRVRLERMRAQGKMVGKCRIRVREDLRHLVPAKLLKLER